MLARDGAEEAEASAGPRREVHCLGYCHRSPATLAADGEVRAADPPADGVRCLARRAVVTERLLEGDFSSLERARSAGVYRALAAALEGDPGATLATLEASGERGRGGAGFPTGRKWRLCAESPGPERVVVKKLLAEQTLDNTILKEAASGNF